MMRDFMLWWCRQSKNKVNLSVRILRNRRSVVKGKNRNQRRRRRQRQLSLLSLSVKRPGPWLQQKRLHQTKSNSAPSSRPWRKKRALKTTSDQMHLSMTRGGHLWWRRQSRNKLKLAARSKQPLPLSLVRLMLMPSQRRAEEARKTSKRIR